MYTNISVTCVCWGAKLPDNRESVIRPHVAYLPTQQEGQGEKETVLMTCTVFQVRITVNLLQLFSFFSYFLIDTVDADVCV